MSSEMRYRAPLAVLVVVVAANAIASAYVHEEKYAYFWDYAVFWLNYHRLGSLFDRSWSLAFKSVLESVWFEDYNLLAVLPLMPLRSWFGDSRIGYTLAIVNTLLVPAMVVLALAARGLASQLGRPDSFGIFLTSLLVALLSHYWWIPVLRGFPDVEGVLLMAVILLVYFRKPLYEQHPAALVLIGLLLFLMVIMRRWYAFWVVAFFPASMIEHAFSPLADGAYRLRQWWLSIRNAAVIGLIFVAALFLFAKPFAMRALGTDYADVHSAYRSSDPIRGGLVLLENYLGFALVLATIAGLVVLISRRASRRTGLFLTSQAVVVLALFPPIQTIDIDHYYLLAPSVTIGLVALIAGSWTVISSRWAAYGVSAAVILTLLVGSAKALVPGMTVPDRIGSILTTADARPLVRQDLAAIDGILSMIERLAQGDDDRVYVLASSVTLNSHLLQVRCQVRDIPCRAAGKIRSTHDVDKRDGFPQTFMQSNLVVVADPIQYHLNPKDQVVVGLLAEEMLGESRIADHFSRLPAEFVLDGNVRVRIFKKERPFLPEDVTYLSDKLRKIYPDRESIYRIDSPSSEGSSGQ